MHEVDGGLKDDDEKVAHQKMLNGVCDSVVLVSLNDHYLGKSFSSSRFHHINYGDEMP